MLFARGEADRGTQIGGRGLGDGAAELWPLVSTGIAATAGQVPA